VPDAPLLRIRNLTKTFVTKRGTVQAVTDVSFDIPRGSITGLVGESGSGKTTLGRTLLRLVEPTSGSTEFDGQVINRLGPAEMRALRRRMQIIFQDPVSSLNPRLKVGQIIAEGLIAQKVGSPAERRARVASLLGEVGLASDAATRYPHEFSGGQRQRIGIARALILNPEFIVCDEPVSALDVSIQAQIIALLDDLKRELGLTYLFISHDISVIGYVSERVAVMYLGEVVEEGPTRSVLAAPRHPYTQALLSAVPRVEHVGAGHERIRLTGDLPSPIDPPPGCRFHTRCPYATDICRSQAPRRRRVGPDHAAACHLLDGGSS